MAICPFAQQKTIGNGTGGGAFTAGPFKIVHHTTESSTASSAFNAYGTGGSEPHFTVDATTVYQHHDTGKGSRALRNDAGGVETNRLSAVQIEIVGFAGKAKDRATLKQVARLCRWLETQHGIPVTWPNGAPKPHKNGKDPGGHNRDAATWASKGGHYGHSQVPENIHWDPAYTAEEWDFVTNAKFAADGKLLTPLPPAPQETSEEESFEIMQDHSRVEDKAP